MHGVLAHRGPDDSGIWHDGAIGFAHRRLAIIDLSPGGHQPMSNAAGTIWITYNGEIYNFMELRQELEAQGVVFRSRSDTEVIIALYEREGERFLQKLRGMFALAIWDGRDRSLLLARDRAGKKPLVYYRDGEKLLFASEPKAIFEDATVPVAANMLAIHDYLTWGYVPSPQSAFEGFAKVPPAHYAVIRDGKIRIERYWELRYEPKWHGSEEGLCRELLAEVREAVRLRMLASDVPVGAFLSGGIDSSTIVALMSEFSAGPVKTYSIGFEEDEYNELPYARLVAQRYATDHHEFIVKPDAMAVLPELVWHYNEPYADSSAVPTYYLAKMTRQHVTVALNGDAGDENFAGYERYLGMRLATWFDRLPRAVRRGIEIGTRRLPDVGHPRGLYRRGRRFLSAACQDPLRRYTGWVAFFPNQSKHELYTKAFAAATASRNSVDLLLDAYARAHVKNEVDGILAVDVATYLPDDLLVKVDIASMAHALEARSPLVDHKVMEWAARLPANYKLRGRTTKYLLKQAARSLLPAEVIDRRKQGFGVPINRWFQRELRDMAYDVLLSRRARDRQLFEPAYVQRMLDEHMAGTMTWHPQLWCLLMLELWFRRFIDARADAGSAV